MLVGLMALHPVLGGDDERIGMEPVAGTGEIFSQTSHWSFVQSNVQ
jgi:hypothetical protein